MFTLKNFFTANIFLFLLFINIALNLVEGAIRFHNETLNHRRDRRYLIFSGGGVSKMAFGCIYPLYLEDPIKWRQMNCAYNIQPQYSVPTTPLYPWEKFQKYQGRSFKPNLDNFNQSYEQQKSYKPDDSRKLIYIAIETFMNNRGKKGQKCLLRAICENAQIHDHHCFFSEILHVILTPGIEDISDVYKDAYHAGMAGIDCLELFKECPKGDSFLDMITVFL